MALFRWGIDDAEFRSRTGSLDQHRACELAARAGRGAAASPAAGPCGWYGTVAEFFALDQATLLASLSSRHLQVMGAPPSGDQAEAWRGEYEILGAALREIAGSAARAGEWGVVFEYELPHERGHRPDVVILTRAQVLVLEFKETATLLEAHVDQVAHAEAMEKQGFRLYLTHELEPARGHVRETSAGCTSQCRLCCFVHTTKVVTW
ncbi:MAG: hypothetical protein LLG45_13070 [Actinomycetia bacterium]|nr:hypothetical protein [Actinomycetes bacterium]